jgi:primosomal protein N'
LNIIATRYKNVKNSDIPHFKTFIKITLEGKKEVVIKNMNDVQETLADYDVLAFPAFVQDVPHKYRMHMLIKLDKKSWVDKRLLSMLRSLPPSFSINVDPENLFVKYKAVRNASL